ncbi:hypothetical protein THAOC_29477, partial [Thalassiosira oceanica]
GAAGSGIDEDRRRRSRPNHSEAEEYKPARDGGAAAQRADRGKEAFRYEYDGGDIPGQ